MQVDRKTERVLKAMEDAQKMISAASKEQEELMSRVNRNVCSDDRQPLDVFSRAHPDAPLTENERMVLNRHWTAQLATDRAESSGGL